MEFTSIKYKAIIVAIILLLIASIDTNNYKSFKNTCEPLNFETRTGQRTNIYTPNSRLLQGKGVCIGVGDGGRLGSHIDLVNRFINGTTTHYSSFGEHGDHIAGTIAGAGNLNPNHRGVAPQSNLIIQTAFNIINYTPIYYNQYNMVLTSNAYNTAAFDCATTGEYDIFSNNIDKQLNDYPDVLHCVAVGNTGSNICGDYPQGYGTVEKGLASAKNVLSIGTVHHNDIVATGSSKGATKDGRIKPEIVGIGNNVVSTGRNYNYFNNSGSSMATAAVTGTLALLYERYRQLHNGVNPKGALIKAIVCNTSDDLGNVGVDYAHGFGRINGHRALDVLNKGHYYSDSITNGVTKTHTINILDGVKQINVMLYWSDKEAEADVTNTLVNDLDVRVVHPNTAPYYPYILNPNPLSINEPASVGIDRINNIEQVCIIDPTGGNYKIEIKGHNIQTTKQYYHVVYEIIESSITITYPNKYDKLEPNTTEYIRFDAFGMEVFNVDYSLDNGVTWQSIDSNITSNMIQWNVPNVSTVEARIRVLDVIEGTVSISDKFTILNVPKNLQSTQQTTTSITLNWDAVEDGYSYEVMVLDTFMKQQLITSDSSVVIEGLTPNTPYWFSVRTLALNGEYSKRSNAILVNTNDIVLHADDLHFTATKNGTDAVLSWITNNDTDYVEVWGSTGGDFKIIGQTKNSQFIDDRFKTGKQYYKIKHIDKQGQVQQSKVKILDFYNANIFVSPNPFQNQLKINSTKQVSSISLIDAMGNVIMKRYNTNTLDTEALKEGIYFVIVVIEGIVLNFKVIKM